jgi:hypothetical protein
MHDNHPRTQVWVDPKFQSRILLRVGIYILGCSLIVLHSAFFFELIWQNLGTGPHKSFLGSYCDFFARYAFMLFALALIMPAVLFDTLKFSHRVAGPLFRCRKTMQAMIDGRPVTEFTPRKHDLMEDLLQTFNGLIKEWNRRKCVIDEETAPCAEQETAITGQVCGHK